LMSATEIVPNTNIPNTNIVAVTEMPFPDSATTGGAVISDGIPPGEIINNTAIISNTNEAITEVTEPFFASAMTELSISAVDAEPAITAAVSEPAITAAVSESAIAVAEPSNGVVVASAQQNAPDTQAVQPVNKTTDITIIRSTDAQTTRQIAERATLLINARQYPQAAALLEQILTLQPSSMQALILYGSLQLNLGNQSSASEIFSRVISIDPSNVSARVGFLKSIPGYSAEDLISELSRLQQTSPDNHLLAFELGRAFATQSRWTEAARSFSRALELAGRSTANNQVLPEYAFNLAVSLDRSGERMLATRYYNEALDRSGSLPTGFDPEVVKQRVNVLSGR
jgi:tetratricopeptide (TPR) repeat protein